MIDMPPEVMLPRAKFRTITAPDWVRALREARAHRREALERLRNQISPAQRKPKPTEPHGKSE